MSFCDDWYVLSSDTYYIEGREYGYHDARHYLTRVMGMETKEASIYLKRLRIRYYAREAEACQE